MQDERSSADPQWVASEEFVHTVESVFKWLQESTPLKVVWDRLQRSGLSRERSRLVVDVARTRFRAKVKFSRWNEVFFTREGLRWATPEVVGAALAERIEGYSMLDLGSGQGGQIIHRRGAKETCAVDIDPLNVSLAERNVEVYGADVEVMVGDALDSQLAERLKGFEVVFSDPYRGESAPVRALEELEPNPLRLMKLYGRYEREGFVFEVPPQIREKRIPFDAELEFVSLDGRYNRLNLYTGELKRCSRSVVILPEGFRLEADPPFRDPPPPVEPFLRDLGAYIYEVDPAVARSQLLGEALEGIPGEFLLVERGRRTLITSQEVFISPIFRRRYRVLRKVRTLPEVRAALKEEGFSKASLRFTVDPADYWRIRKSLEQGLPEGEEKATIFKVSEHFLVTVMEE